MSTSDMSGFGPAPAAFSITGPGQLGIDEKLRQGTTSFTVTNLTGRPVRARLIPAAGPGADASWFSVAGSNEVPIPVGGTISVQVNVAIPPRAAQGTGLLRLDVVPEDDTDTLVQGPSASFVVPPPVGGGCLKWVLLALLIVLVLALVGGGLLYWFKFRVPDESPTETPRPSKTRTKSPTPTPTPTPSPSEPPSPSPDPSILRWSNWTTVDPGTRVFSGPAVVSIANRRLDVFARDQSAQIVQWTSQNGVWQAPQQHPGFVSDRPAVTSRQPGSMDLVVHSSDGNLASKSFDGGVWSDYTPFPDGSYSSPTVCSWGAQRLDVFALAGDNSLQHRVWNGVWGDWQTVSGNFVGSPACVAREEDRFELFIRGGDNHLYQLSWNGSTLTPPKDLGAGMYNDVAAASWSADRVDLFTKDDGDALLHRWWDGTQWTDWEQIATGISDVPGAYAIAPGRIQVVARSAADRLIAKSSRF